MARLLLIIKVFSLAILWLITGVLTEMYIRRSGWEYEANGRYFDHDSGTTYDDGAVLVIGGALVLFSLVSVVCTFLFVRGWRKRTAKRSG